MGFSIDYDIGALGGVLIAMLITVGIMVAVVLIIAAKKTRDSVVEDEGDDKDLIA